MPFYLDLYVKPRFAKTFEVAALSGYAALHQVFVTEMSGYEFELSQSGENM
jgi:hypothetical protein